MFRTLLSSGPASGLFRTLIVLMLLAMAGALAADPAQTGRQAMSEGIEQFRLGNYHAAREQFEAALAQGVDSPALHYNLAVACFKTGDYRAAEASFSKLLGGPDAALANYNLGLVALADGRADLAEQRFVQASGADASEAIRELARRQLSELASRRAPAYQSPALVAQGYLSTGIGYDSNIEGVPEDSSSNRSSLYAELIAAGALRQVITPDWRLVWDGVAYSQDYVQGSRFDATVVQGKLAGIRSYKGVDVGVRAGLTRAWLEDDVLETRFGATLFAQTDECLVGPLHACSLALTAEQVDGGRDYLAYSGQQYQFEARAEQRHGSLMLDTFYRWSINDRKDFSDGDFFVSVSPTSHQLGAEVLYPLRSDLAIGADMALRHARYDRPHQWIDEGVLTSRRRKDVRLELGLMAEIYLNSRWLVRNQWLFRDQNSRLSRYDYQRHTYLVSLEGVF